MLCMECCITFSDLLSRGERDRFLEMASWWELSLQEQHNVDYYDHLRIMQGPIKLPDWVHEPDVLDLGQNLQDEIQKIFS